MDFQSHEDIVNNEVLSGFAVNEAAATQLTCSDMQLPQCRKLLLVSYDDVLSRERRRVGGEV
jgi:hypothetical protein